MQLSEDGNYMWNGSEWVPVEQAPAEEATSVIAAPDEMASTVEEIRSKCNKLLNLKPLW